MGDKTMRSCVGLLVTLAACTIFADASNLQEQANSSPEKVVIPEGEFLETMTAVSTTTTTGQKSGVGTSPGNIVPEAEFLQTTAAVYEDPPECHGKNLDECQSQGSVLPPNWRNRRDLSPICGPWACGLFGICAGKKHCLRLKYQS